MNSEGVMKLKRKKDLQIIKLEEKEVTGGNGRLIR